MFKLRFTDNKHGAVWLVEPKVSIGRATDNDLVVDEPDVAEHHAEVRVSGDSLTLVRHTDGAVTVNGRVLERSAALKLGDRVAVGGRTLEVIDPKSEPRRKPAAPTTWALKANHSALANRSYPLAEQTVVGRSRDCDISLAVAHLSRRHAKLAVEDGLLYVRDLGSANGTYLNGERITEARVRRGDELRFDTLSFGVIGPPAEDLDRTTVRPAVKVDTTAAQMAKTSPERRSTAAAPRRGSAHQSGDRPPVSRPRSDDSVARATATPGGRPWLWAAVVAIVVLGAGLAWQQGWIAL